MRFESDALVWAPCDGEERRVAWSAIYSVASRDDGAMVLSSGAPLLIPKDVVWFEFVVEDVVGKARQANPNYDGPVPEEKPRDLKIPKDSSKQQYYIRRAQRFYKDRCPNLQEFQAFLEANPDWEFLENSYYECSMSMCSGSPVDEGYSTDLVIPSSESWYRKFEKRVKSGRHTGRKLLEVLKDIESR